MHVLAILHNPVEFLNSNVFYKINMVLFITTHFSEILHKPDGSPSLKYANYEQQHTCMTNEIEERKKLPVTPQNIFF
jgi:hypothetical protein